MYKLLFDQKVRVAHWVAHKVEQETVWTGCYAMGVEIDRTIVAGIVFEGWNGSNAMCHVAIDKTGRHVVELLRHAANYAFAENNLNRITGLVESTNREALRFDKHIGFEHEFTMPKAGRDGADMHVLVLWPENFRYKDFPL